MALDNAYRKNEIIAGMHLLRTRGEATVHRTAPLIPPDQAELSTLDRIQARQTIRVGYVPDALPFVYFNAAGELVGFDVEMAYTLARDLKVRLEFVPIGRDQIVEQITAGYCDIMVPGLAISPERAQALSLSVPYLRQTMAFIVKDHRRKEFSSRAAVRRLKAPRIGVPNVPYYIDKVQRYLPQAELVILNTINEFFEGRGETLDALVYSAEAGSAWTLLYPAYTVAIPQPDVLTVPIAYAMAPNDQKMVNFLNLWLELKKEDRTITSLYDYWILGKNAVPTPPRWSVVRNVLHWVP
jgi:ABC-type amino acid transport substrate-binding protein